MSATALRCPECGCVLGLERANGNIRPLVLAAPFGQDGARLVCPCGGQLVVPGVRVILLSSRKSS